MKRVLSMLLTLSLLLLTSACSSTPESTVGAAAMSAHADTPQQQRMLIWRGWLTVEVDDIATATQRVTEIAQASSGFVESRSETRDESAMLTLRIPATALNATVASLESIGTVRSRRLSADDVTEQYIDADARLKNQQALRDRLRLLLDKASTVEDILAIETELARVQGEIDSLQGRLKAVKGQVDLATLEVSLERRRILGPLGYLVKGSWWVIEKLFVIRD